MATTHRLLTSHRYTMFVLILITLMSFHSVTADDKSAPYFKKVKIHSDVHYRFSTTLITGELVNENKKAEKIIWDVILPEQFYVSNFTANIADHSYYGKVVTKSDQVHNARRQFIHPPRTSLFTLQLNIPAKSTVNISVIYHGLLKRRLGLYEHIMYLLPGQEIENLDIDVNIEETNDITKIKVPPMMGLSQQATIKEMTSRSVAVTYSANKFQLNNLSKHVVGKFCIKFDVKREDDVSNNLLVSNGYFVHFLSINKSPILPKDIIFVLDVSGSMYLTGMDKVKSVMYTILSDLKQNDRFGLVFYNHNVNAWKDELSSVTKESIDKAKEEIDKCSPFGRSDINNAILKSLSLLKEADKPETTQAQAVFFLTDGVASEGELKTPRILDNVHQANTMNVPIYSIFLGDANYELVNQLSFQSQGLSYKISSSENIPTKLKEFYEHATSILALQLKFEYADNAALKTTSTNFKTFQKGSEIVVAGTLSDKSVKNIKSTFRCSTSEGLKDFTVESAQLPSSSGKSKRFLTEAERHQIPEKIFAFLSTQQAVDNSLFNSDEKEQVKWQQAAVKLALEYNYLMSLTSMEILKSQKRNGKLLGHGEVNELFPSDSRTFGVYGKYGGGGGDPHFIMDIRGLSIPICFNVAGHLKRAMILVDDPSTRIKAEAVIIEGHPKHWKRYMAEIKIVAPGLTLIATTKHVRINSKPFSWTVESTLTAPTSDVVNFGNGKNIAVRIGGLVEFEIKRITHPKQENRTDFLDFYILKGNGLSMKTRGILGSLLHLTGHVRWTKKSLNGKMSAQLQISNHFSRRRINVPVILKKRPDPLTQRKPCWMLWQKSYSQLAFL
ncbi:inter-alpha-trypsin inhibitor heavy chain H3-like [Octopus sinensis]|uniref:Inter-alpha-trypsin inhibitor heavy chain H3-like n=1 Tax=Octopus sinensis TaxID=2607531 RepID=A0A6P7TJT7_9MOLL|nr:inter-alpha-trypsin inhibitor heavy chain H3-like [Octopus sinensis]